MSFLFRTDTSAVLCVQPPRSKAAIPCPTWFCYISVRYYSLYIVNVLYFIRLLYKEYYSQKRAKSQAFLQKNRAFFNFVEGHKSRLSFLPDLCIRNDYISHVKVRRFRQKCNPSQLHSAVFVQYSEDGIHLLFAPQFYTFCLFLSRFFGDRYTIIKK